MASATGTRTISGKCLHKESGAGIGDLVVELFDLDQWADPEQQEPSGAPRMAAVAPESNLSILQKGADRLGSARTDGAGEFQLTISPQDFNLGRATEQKPDLVMLVLAPDEPGMTVEKRLLHLTRDIRFNSGTQESYVIRLSSDLLNSHAIPYGPRSEQKLTSARADAERYVAQVNWDKSFADGVTELRAAEAKKDTEARAKYRKVLLGKLAANATVPRAGGVLAAEGDPIDQRNNEVIAQGVTAANLLLSGPQAQGVPVNLYLTPSDLEDLEQWLNNPVDGMVEIPEEHVRDILFRINSSENPGTLLIHNNPIAKFCMAESADEICAKRHTGLPTHGADDEHEHGTTDTDSTDTSGGDGVVVDADIAGYVSRLLKQMPAPDKVLSGKQPAPGTIDATVNAFSLQKGPAEIPAFYDFHSLQIAFDHVWKQLFDEEIPNLAYTANTQARSLFSVNDLIDTSLRDGMVFVDLATALAATNVPPVVAQYFDVTKQEFNELEHAMRQELISIATEMKTLQTPTSHWLLSSLAWKSTTPQAQRVLQAYSERGERIIDTVRSDDYHTLHKTLRDLQERLTSKYEFTIFAADKDYHSVNFGLMNTYRQQWTPLNYQAGKLVKTVPLAPNEERTWSMKVTRNEKRSSKEAKRNNSSITNEQNSVSRVESEIVAKALNKSTFSATAEGEYDIGISEGKGTSTFGIEAVNESAQTRKDFREAVLKAAQDYKQEVSTEVSTQGELTSEGAETGRIRNDNQELSVAYLFYELQKRYRVSEQIYRVQPVVLVAQQMPTPDQITPAWVLANDWILNRHLLDDSFRPVLQYLANNSVGEDFAMRELRKNLRQQRILVETLKIEFASASANAENKYRALLNKINERISAQSEANNEGFFTNVAATFGYNDADPETARARETAASDEHRYAVERAEKMAASLREEVSSLHAVTEQFNKAMQSRLDNETRVRRLLVHLRNNIFYYMQAIWSLEPPDQRFLRLHKVNVPVLELESGSFSVNMEVEDDIFSRFRESGTEKHRAYMRGRLKHDASGGFELRALVEVADIGNLLGFKGNYMVFPLKEHNALTRFMAAPYVDSAFGAMDPDELANLNLDQFSKYVCCLHEQLPAAEFDELRGPLKAWLEKLMAAPLRNGDEIVVPTGSLFIQALVDQNPLLEDFKLKHRELDVYKVQEEVRKAALENVRLAARLVNQERGDPDIEKKIVVTGGVSPVIDVDDP